MSTTQTIDSLKALLDTLPDDQQEAIELAPRSERLTRLAKALAHPETQTLQQISQLSGLPALTRFQAIVEGDHGIPLRLIHEYQCLPIEDETNSHDEIAMLTGWPPEPYFSTWIVATSGKYPRWHLGPPELIAETINQAFGVGSGSLDDSGLNELAEDESGSEEENQNAAIIRFINEIVVKAVHDRATDIHFEPQRETLQIRYRIDGDLEPVRVPENLVQFQGAIISRLKIMARLNISERRRPQDGRIAFNSGGQELDIRISTLPTMYGESVSLRLLNQKSQPLSISQLGLLQDDETILMRAARKPHGIILVTGPTGSGKSTTLTAVMRRIKSADRRIITVEDPVEYEVEGINQTQVKPEIGLDFASALRTVLRQDPDIIMVGEIRDRETADIAIRASLTGHLVLSTLHTNDAAGALTRLTDMGIEPFLIASSVELIIAQRLLRRLNPGHTRPAQHEQLYLRSCLAALGVKPDEIQYAKQLLEPDTSEKSRGLGYRGRLGIFEMLTVNEDIHELIVDKASARAIRNRALKQGMRTLQRCAWEQVKAGNTSLTEIMRLAETTEEDHLDAGDEILKDE